MKTLQWFSRHDLTNGQVATIKTMGYTDYEKHNMVFNDDIVEQVQNITEDKTIALVAPVKYALFLLREGYNLIEFENIPSARTKGVFLCKGAWWHSLNQSEFFDCPIPFEEQETGDLSYNKER